MVAIQCNQVTARLRLPLILVFGFLIINAAHGQKRVTGSHFCKQGKVSWYGFQKDESDNDRSDTLDLASQHIILDVTDFSGHTIKGSCYSRFSSLLDNVGSISFDLLSMTIDSVTSTNGAILPYSYNDELLVVQLPEELNTGDTSSVWIHYQGTPTLDDSGWGGWYWTGNYAFNLGVGFAAEPHNYGRAWFPCFDNFAERCTYSFSVLTSGGKNAWCNGELMSIDTLNTDSIVSHWAMNEEIPSYLVSVAVSTYTSAVDMFASLGGNEIPMHLTAHASDTAAVKASFIHLTDAMDAFESGYGVYQWPRVGYAFVPFNGGAMEHATNIAYPVALANGSLTYETLMAHELAHHWWGDLVTCRTKEDMWINEGMASYSEALFIEWLEGSEAYLDYVKENRKDVLTTAHESDGGYFPVSGIGTEITYGDHVYNKGADVAHNLRLLLGDEDFFAALTSFLEENAFSSVTSEQLRDHLDASSSQDVSSFFNPMIFNPGFMEFSIDGYSITEVGDSEEITIDIRQKLHYAPEFYGNAPLEITVMDLMGNTETFNVIADGQYSTVSVTTSLETEKVFLEFAGKLNQAVLGETQTMYETGITNFNYAEFYFDIDAMNEGDSIWLHVENHWVAADPLQSQVEFHIADDRFWRIDGFIPDDAETMGRISYTGNPIGTNYFDPLFFEELSANQLNEDSLILVYRPDASHLWQEYDDYELNVQGSANNSQGQIKFYQVRPGDYAWAFRTGEIYVNNLDPLAGLSIYPNPATDIVQIQGFQEGDKIHIFDASGRLVLTSSDSIISVNSLSRGQYTVRIQRASTIIQSMHLTCH